MLKGLVGKRYCHHRWSKIKSWEKDGRYYVIERCRYCDCWKRKHIQLNEEAVNRHLEVKTDFYQEQELPKKASAPLARSIRTAVDPA